MIVRSGTAVSFPILFAEGRPDAGVSYTVYDPAGVVLATGTVAVPGDAVSIYLQVDGATNLLATNALLSYRDIEWSYAVGGRIMTGEARYTVEARLPYGVSADGVRAKLGVDKTDLPDSDISLARAYLNFQGIVGVDRLAAHDPADITVTDAIEAQAALVLIPTMAVRVATKESSGTNQFQRQAIDWDAVATALEGMVSAGYSAVDPAYDETEAFGSLLIVVTPATDAITGVTG